MLDVCQMRLVCRMISWTEVRLMKGGENDSWSKKLRSKSDVNDWFSKKKRWLKKLNKCKHPIGPQYCCSSLTKFWLKIFQSWMFQKFWKNCSRTILGLIRCSRSIISKRWSASIQLTVRSSQWWAWTGTRWTSQGESWRWLSSQIDN